MYVPVVADKLRLTYFTWLGGQVGISGLHFNVQSVTGGGVNLLAIATQYYTLIQGPLTGILSEQALFLGVKCETVNVLPKPLPGIVTNIQPGVLVGEDMPKQVSGVITWQTALAGRSNRGRSYTPFPIEDFNTNEGAPTSAYITLLGDLAAAQLSLTAVTDGGATTDLLPIIYHPSPALSVPIIAYRPNTRWGTQRSRGDYGSPQPPVIT